MSTPVSEGNVPAPPPDPDDRAPTLSTPVGTVGAAPVWFQADLQAATLARAETRSVLRLQAVGHTTIAQAELLVSELVTNVVRHTSSARVGLVVLVTPELVRVEVHEDRASEVPGHVRLADRQVPASATSGRGMGIMDWLAAEWGITRRRRFTSTWFTIAVPGTDLPAADLATAYPDDAPVAGRPATSLATGGVNVLLRLTEALSRAASAAQVGDVITRTVRDEVGAVFTGIALADAATGTMTYLSLDPLPAETAAHWQTFPLDRSAPVGRAALDGEAYFHSSPEDAERGFPGLAEHMVVAGTASLAHLPLTSSGRTFGTLGVAWRDAREIDLDTRTLLLIVAGCAAQALAAR